MSKYSKDFKLSEDGKKIFYENKWSELGNKNPRDIELSFLILGFNRDEETYALLQSISEKCLLKNYEVVMLSNGGFQENTFNFYKAGYIDRLILNKQNDGCGISTHELFDIAKAKYSIYVQIDHILNRNFSDEEFSRMKMCLDNGYDSIDLSGGAGHNDKFSERAFIIKTETYKNLPIKAYGGPGPFEEDFFWSEGAASISFWEKNLAIHHSWPILFGNTGYRTVRENKNGEIKEIKLI